MTLAALLGGVPLMLETGTGSELRQPLGYTIVGGLMLSQILTLYTTPVAYLCLDALGERIARLRTPHAPRDAKVGGVSVSKQVNPATWTRPQ